MLSTSSLRGGHLPQLNGIRTIALGLVLLFHWLPQTHWINVFNNGAIGVTLFFVLSGYLITEILLKNTANNGKEFAFTYRNFMIRRALRIFPIYYLALFIVWILPHLNIKDLPSDIHTKPLYYIFYFYNHLLEQSGNWGDILSPFWTLAVEEQFYLVWAIFLLALPKKMSLAFLVSTLFLGVVMRWYFISFQEGRGLFTITCVDCFAWGGLLSWFKLNGKLASLRKPLLILSLVSIAFVVYATFVKNPVSTFLHILFFRTAISAICTFIIWGLIVNSEGWFTKLMAFYPISYIGKISYGMYVYHMLVPALYLIIVRKFHLPLPTDSLLFNLIVLIAASMISWKIIENPINSLKQFFPYKRKKTELVSL